MLRCETCTSEESHWVHVEHEVEALHSVGVIHVTRMCLNCGRLTGLDGIEPR